MEKFASTDDLMRLLESGEYKRLVMEDDEDVLKSEEDFEEVFENYKAYTSRPDNYDYLAVVQ
jgi:hypothetical protein